MDAPTPSHRKPLVPPAPRNRQTARTHRDAALRRVSAARRLIAGASALGTAAFAALVAATAPGKTYHAPAVKPVHGRHPTAPRRARTLPPLASPSALGLAAPRPAAPAPPAAPPAADPGAGGGQVVSGAS